MSHQSQCFSAEKILANCSIAVPRYTSYPTAPHFDANLGEIMIAELLGSIKPNQPISLYIHIPYCDRLCWFCGCHTKHTLKYEPVADYLKSLHQEISLIHDRLGFKPKLARLHLGGGSPSMVRSDDFNNLRAQLDTAFAIDKSTEISVEIDPSDVTEDTLIGLKALGLTRASIGVQDFDPKVQKAINRIQTFETTRDVVIALRDMGVQSLNIDALYGLPLQDESKVIQTIHQVISLKPDRVALFGYAHIPWLKKHQQMIRDADLPGALARFTQAKAASDLLTSEGYQTVGIDHFAKPQDDLAIAAGTGNLHRNFQGYTTDHYSTLLGLGASSISSFDGGFVQNIVPTGQYRETVAKGEIPAARGLKLTKDDRIRAFIIERLMCDFKFSFSELKKNFPKRAQLYIEEAHHIADTDDQGLCSVSDEKFEIAPAAIPFARIVASKFDAYLNNSGARYSKAV